jgi:hypothetical protein
VVTIALTTPYLWLRYFALPPRLLTGNSGLVGGYWSLPDARDRLDGGRDAPTSLSIPSPPDFAPTSTRYANTPEIVSVHRSTGERILRLCQPVCPAGRLLTPDYEVPDVARRGGSLD